MAECGVALVLTPECSVSRRQLRQMLLNNIADASWDCLHCADCSGSGCRDCSRSRSADGSPASRASTDQEDRSPLKGPALESISRRLFQPSQGGDAQHVQGLSRPKGPLSAGQATLPAQPQPYVRDILTRKKQVIRKRKRILLASAEKIQRVYMSECNRDTYSQDAVERARRKIVLSLFHDKEFTVDCTE